MAITAGYDVGGAHLKVALAEDGRIVAVEQIPCPLWQGLDRLDAAFAEAAPLIARAGRPRRDHDRGTVRTLPRPVRPAFAPSSIGLAPLLPPGLPRLDGLRRLRHRRQAARRRADERRLDQFPRQRRARCSRAYPRRCSSTWARRRPTSSPSPTAGLQPRGITDGERLATGELVYTGSDAHRRQQSLPSGRRLRGPEQRLAAGGFATMADVRRVLGELARRRRSARHRSTAAAHRSRKAWRASPAASAAMAETPRSKIGAHAARDIADRQLAEVRSCHARCSGALDAAGDAPVVAAGIGAAQIEAIAHALGRSRLCASPPWPMPLPIAKIGPPAARPPSPSPCSRSPRPSGLAGAEGGDLFHQPAPRLFLARARRLGDGDFEILQLGVDLLRRQHLEARRQHGALQHRRLGAIEPLPRPVARLVHEAARIARALRILGDLRHRQLPMRHRIGQHHARHAVRPRRVGQSLRPVTQPAKTRTSSVWLATAYGT